LAIELTVSGSAYQYPENRDAAGWGEEATAWAQAVTSALTNVSGTGDIPQTSFSLENSGGPLPITDFAFDPLQVRAAICEYAIYRKTDTAGDERIEVGTIHLGYKTVADTWEITVSGAGNAGVTLSITDAGQVEYTVSEPLDGANYSGAIKFRARALTI
jgi:hypothetical protein